jgi:lysosomal Pro-X carboxypeptidase
MWDIAPEFGALLVFAEHRYYGESLPFGAESRSKDPMKVGYLSSSQVQSTSILLSSTMASNVQALADFVDLITYIRQSVEGASESPVVAFGGSYGGMLAACIRTKYPHIVQV